MSHILTYPSGMEVHIPLVPTGLTRIGNVQPSKYVELILHQEIRYGEKKQCLCYSKEKKRSQNEYFSLFLKLPRFILAVEALPIHSVLLCTSKYFYLYKVINIYCAILVTIFMHINMVWPFTSFLLLPAVL